MESNGKKNADRNKHKVYMNLIWRIRRSSLRGVERRLACLEHGTWRRDPTSNFSHGVLFVVKDGMCSRESMHKSERAVCYKHGSTKRIPVGSLGERDPGAIAKVPRLSHRIKHQNQAYRSQSPNMSVEVDVMLMEQRRAGR